MNFADTNWLVSMFIAPSSDELEKRAKIVKRFLRQNPGIIYISQIVLFEARNVFSRLMKEPVPGEWSELLTSELFYRDTMDWDLLKHEGFRIFEKYSHIESIGSLDAAIIASAILSGTRQILSFDELLKALAAAEGLAVFPSLKSEGKEILSRLKKTAS